MKQSEVDKLKKMYAHYNYICFICPKRANQRAHIIGKTDANYKKYGAEIVDNILNWLPACCIDHNDTIDLGKNDYLLNRVADIIKSDLKNKRELIEEIVLENVQRKRNKSN